VERPRPADLGRGYLVGELQCEPIATYDHQPALAHGLLHAAAELLAADAGTRLYRDPAAHPVVVMVHGLVGGQVPRDGLVLGGEASCPVRTELLRDGG